MRPSAATPASDGRDRHDRRRYQTSARRGRLAIAVRYTIFGGMRPLPWPAPKELRNPAGYVEAFQPDRCDTVRSRGTPPQQTCCESAERNPLERLVQQDPSAIPKVPADEAPDRAPVHADEATFATSDTTGRREAFSSRWPMCSTQFSLSSVRGLDERDHGDVQRLAQASEAEGSRFDRASLESADVLSAPPAPLLGSPCPSCNLSEASAASN